MFWHFNIQIERWKFNKDYGVYVSNFGYFKDRHKRLLPLKVNNQGYCLVKTERGYIYAHRLVGFTWLPIPNTERLTIDHLDHNKRNNNVSNLEWVTRRENQKRATEDFYLGPPTNDFGESQSWVVTFRGHKYTDIEKLAKAIHLTNTNRKVEKCKEIAERLISGQNPTGKKVLKTGTLTIEWR